MKLRNLFGTDQLPDPVVAVHDHDLTEQAIALGRAQGYAEALVDLSDALKQCNSFALLSIEPAVRKLQYKAKLMSHRAKGE